MLKGMKIGSKIIGGYLLVVLLLAVVAGVAILGIRNLNTNVGEIVHEHVPAADASMEMMIAVIATRDLMGEYWINEDPAVRAELRQEFDALEVEFDEWQKQLVGLSLTKEQQQQLEEAEELHVEFVQACRVYMDALDEELQTKQRVHAKMEEYDAAVNSITGSASLEVLLWKQAMAANDFIITGDEALVQEYLSLQRQIESAAGYSTIAAAHTTAYKLGEELLTVQQEHLDDGVAAAAMMAQLDSIGTELDEGHLDKIEELSAEELNDAGEAAVATGKISLNATILVSAFAALLGILLGVTLTRVITRPLNKMVGAAQTIASGDLSQVVEVKSRDEIGVLGNAFNTMTTKLNQMMREVMQAAEQVSSSSEEISSSAQQLSSGAQNQASTLEETSASVEEMTASVEQVADNAQSQAASVEESSSNMEQMQGSVDQVSKTLGEVSTSSQDAMEKAQGGAEAVTKAVEAIKSISESSEQIAGIINVISDIADQTNLLALNASIEAARAGEHGRGFAVVADEVSKLADRSSSSTKEIESLISESSKSVNVGVEIAQAALSSMEAIIGGAQKTNEMVTALTSDIEQQIGAIKEVAKATESISEMSQSISAATEEQTTNAKQVAKAIENVNELTQQAASSAEEMSAATEELSTLAQQMQRLVEQFRLSEDGRGARELPQPAAAGRHMFTPAGEAEVTAVALKKRINGDAA